MRAQGRRDHEAEVSRPWRSGRYAPGMIWSYVERDWRIATSYRLPFALEALSVAAGLFMFYFLGRLIDRSEVLLSQELKAGYFSFALVGLGVLRMVQTSLISFSAKLRREQTTGTLEALLATGPPAGFVILASAAFDLLYATVTAALTLVVGVALGATLQISATSAVALSVGVPSLMLLFTALGVAVAGFTMIFKQTTQLVGALTTALALGGGVYFPLDVLPDGVSTIARFSPFTWGVDLLREAMLFGRLDAPKLAALVGAAAASLPISLWIFGRAVDRSRRTGTLGTY